MRKELLTLIVVFVAAALGLNAQETGFVHDGPIVSGPKEDVEEVKTTLKKMYNALSLRDSSAYGALTTDDYYVLEQGEYWSKAYAKSRVGRKSNNSHYVRNDHLDFRLIEVTGDLACVVWDLRSETLRDGQVHTREWLESGWLKRIDGEWKVAILHSTVAE